MEMKNDSYQQHHWQRSNNNNNQLASAQQFFRLRCGAMTTIMEASIMKGEPRLQGGGSLCSTLPNSGDKCCLESCWADSDV